jgi:hypothetical protein
LVGLVGAGLFNPDDGSLVHSEALWRVFGIGAYLGAAMFWISTLTAAILGLATVLSRVRRGTCH